MGKTLGGFGERGSSPVLRDGPEKKLLTISISSTALFDLSESERVYREEGLEAYRKYQIAAEDEILEPVDGMALVKKIININHDNTTQKKIKQI